jgi:[ribosomal protein S5]-alanine N-acetyltransferase
MTAPQELRTARLLLRSLERADIPDLVRLAGERDVAATTLNIAHPYTILDAESFLAHANTEAAAGRSAIFAICIYPGDELCGTVGLTIAPASRRAELGYWIGVPYWGRGFATEAAGAVLQFGFEALGLRKIHATHFAGNIASQRVLEKIGMRHEGCFRAHAVKWDQEIDLENYGMLACESCNKK